MIIRTVLDQTRDSNPVLQSTTIYPLRHPMGKRLDFLPLPNKHSTVPSTHLNCTTMPPHMALQNACHASVPSANPCIFVTEFDLPTTKLTFSDGSPLLHHCLPISAAKSHAEGMLIGSPLTQVVSCLGPTVFQERFFANQIGNQSELVLNSPSSVANLKPFNTKGFLLLPPIKRENPVVPCFGGELSLCGFKQIDMSGEFKQINMSGAQTEESVMHDDTEDLNALLYSDDEIEEEEASTGHSPLGSPQYEKNCIYDSIGKSCTPPTKRRRLNQDCYDVDLMDTASSRKPPQNEYKVHEDDAESSCIKGSTGLESPLTSNNKLLKREKIRETVGILRSIIPQSKGEDAAVILEEAIQYLTSLKQKV